MFTILTTETFDDWFTGSSHPAAHPSTKRPDGRRKPWGLQGHWQWRVRGPIGFGPGFRLYFIQRDLELLILLCGGDKATQPRDIKTAIALADELNEG